MRAVIESVEVNTHGLYDCPDCDREHTSPMGAALCCDTEYEPD